MTSKEAVETLNKYRNQNYNSTNKDEVEVANAINVILPKYVKQEKLLGHYNDLAEVRKELYDLTTNFKPSNKDRMIVLFTQQTLVSNIIKELENENNR